MEAHGMNRRHALLTSLFLGGLVPARLARGQQAVPRARGDDRGRLDPPRLARRQDEARADDTDRDRPLDDVPADFPAQPGHQWRTFAIDKYTRMAQGQNSNPQEAIIEWVFRRTGSSTWHGDRVTALSASRSRILAYHDARTLDQVEDVVERFTNAVADLITLRVQIVAAADPRWRYAVYQRLNFHEGGPNGQQIWTAKVEDAALVLTQMGATQGFRLLADQEYKVINGQTLTIKATVNKDYTSHLQRASASGLGFQPGTRQISEGLNLRLSPLLNIEGDRLELAMDLRAGTVKKFHVTRVLAPREVGPNEMSIDVPEVSESRINQTIPDWDLDRTLIVSAGILPGILLDKTNLLNRIPGWTPGATELLLFLNAKFASNTPKPARPVDRARSGASDRDRDDVIIEEEEDRVSDRGRTRRR
jgi:hypothetical protein